MRQLKYILKKHSGRRKGTVTVRHQGGREKRFLRLIDFKRDKHDVWGTVEAIEYEPNRNAEVALILYTDGERRYILSPVGLSVGMKVISSDTAPIEPGNSLPLSAIPVGVQINNVEITPGKGGQMVKGAGSAATVFGKDETWVLVKLPSGEIRRFNPICRASIGQVGNVESKNEIIGKAGRMRHMGVRPTVRGVAMNPDSHPHGGGEGRSGIGMKHPKTVYGRSAVGKTRNKKKHSNRMIVQRRGRKANLGK
ncbi:MAG TPA: 50S ribosomal protein L2 [Patescibacteria group bacterium]|nr:50S ribosomal protein L2 [Patescibacteria group bacterium]